MIVLSSRTVLKKLERFKNYFRPMNYTLEEFRKARKKCKELLTNFNAEFTKYKEAGKLQSEQFKYWCVFLDEIMPAPRDLTLSSRRRLEVTYLSSS